MFSEPVYLSPDGETMEREIIDYQAGNMKTWNAPDERDRGMANLLKHGKEVTILWIDDTVASLYCGKPQEDGMMVKHKDGDLTNNAAYNLEWIVPTPEYLLLRWKAETKLYLEVMGIRIENGVVYQNKRPISYCSSGYDRGLSYECPFANIEYKYENSRGGYSCAKIKADTLMDIFGLVAGDAAGFEHPKVLHIDNTRLNYKPENLLWVDESDKRFTDYLAAIKADCIEKEKEANKGKCVPPSRRDLLGTDWV